MFGDLYDAVSLLFSQRWPAVQGEVTAVDLERIEHRRRRDTLRLAIAYKFSIGDDGPYTGVSFWTPGRSGKKRLEAAQQKIHSGQQVVVRYRAGDPSVNVLDRGTWQDL
jgi:Protein of unknown function (DUF3592)